MNARAENRMREARALWQEAVDAEAQGDHEGALVAEANAIVHMEEAVRIDTERLR